MSPQWRTIEKFDHVQHGLAVEEQEEDAASKSSGLRNASEDMKRTLGALHVRVRCTALPLHVCMRCTALPACMFEVHCLHVQSLSTCGLS